MITKITGEQPFQVLTNNFSISPSNEGYTLQISADGINYSNLFTVGAGVTRLVTGVAANSYYKLSGNQSQVSINWMKTCVTEGGGGDMSNYYTKDETDEAIQEAISGISLDGYWTSAETKTYVDSAVTAVENHIFDVEEVTASALTELHDNILELSARTPDLSAFYTSAQTEQAITSKNYVTSAQVETQIVAKNYITSGQVETLVEAYNYVTSADVETQIAEKGYITSADTADFLDSEDGLVISTALNNLNTTKVSSNSVSTIWKGTQAEYDAETTSGQTADPATFYIIVSSN